MVVKKDNVLELPIKRLLDTCDLVNVPKGGSLPLCSGFPGECLGCGVGVWAAHNQSRLAGVTHSRVPSEWTDPLSEKKTTAKRIRAFLRDCLDCFWALRWYLEK